MRAIETDYLVVGAGASGMAFIDALLANSDATVVLVDRRHRPGGHWNDAYPFVRLHQPSATYGVDSRTLGADRIDDAGPNAGFYERATAAEIVEHFAEALDDFVASGRLEFLGMSDYRGEDADGHRVVSLLTGAETTVRVRRKFVDATYTESSIPSRHTPAFAVDADVRFIPPNDLVDLDEPAAGFTIIGGGKTSMDAICWLIDEGVDPDKIEWIRPRDPWVFNRAAFQPLELVGSYMHLQACWVEAAAAAEDGHDFARRLEGPVLSRIDPAVEPTVFRGPTVSELELDTLRSIERVVRDRVQHLKAKPGQVFVDCTAEGVRPTVAIPIFTPGRITLQYVTLGIVPWGAATIGFVEATRDDDDDDEKNRLCPPLVFTGDAADMMRLAHVGMQGLLARGAEPDLAAWAEASRLNPGRGAAEHMDDPRIPAAFATMGANLGAAMTNLQRVAPL